MFLICKGTLLLSIIYVFYQFFQNQNEINSTIPLRELWKFIILQYNKR